jgi:hypothetical protein
VSQITCEKDNAGISPSSVGNRAKLIVSVLFRMATLETCVFSKDILCTVMFAMLPDVSDNYLFNTTYIFVNLYAAVNCNVVPIHTFKAYRGNGSLAPCVLNYCARRNFKLHAPAASSRKRTPVPTGGRQKPCGHSRNFITVT